MARPKKLKPGRRVRARYGTGTVKGVIVRERPAGYYEVAIDIPGASEQISSLLRPDQLTSA